MHYCSIVTDDYISHHGVKGQKWGVRRYQNPDGSWKKKKYKDAVNKYDKSVKLSKVAYEKGIKEAKSRDQFDLKLLNDAINADSKSKVFNLNNKKAIKLGQKIRAKGGDNLANMNLSYAKANRSAGKTALGILFTSLAGLTALSRIADKGSSKTEIGLGLALTGALGISTAKNAISHKRQTKKYFEYREKVFKDNSKKHLVK